MHCDCSHQRINAALAIALASNLESQQTDGAAQKRAASVHQRILPDSYRDGLRLASWPGRCQVRLQHLRVILCTNENILTNGACLSSWAGTWPMTLHSKGAFTCFNVPKSSPGSVTSLSAKCCSKKGFAKMVKFYILTGHQRDLFSWQ